jgi:hypothetical protein
MNIRRLSLTTLQTLDSDYDLSRACFNTENNTEWNSLQVALSAALPPNVLYNLTVYEVNGQSGSSLYTPKRSVSNAESLGVSSDASSYLVASSNVTFDVTPEKIGENGGAAITLYILNCSDSNGWWITGYTSQSLTEDLYRLLSPYFSQTVVVRNTAELGQILNGSSLEGERVQDAVIINTCGEAVPIPSGYYANQSIGYDPDHSSYAMYTYTLGQRVRQYNWTWVSIVGYPLYYVSNDNLFPNEHNSWGISGMKQVGRPGINAFLRGLDGQSYLYNETQITNSLSSPVYLTDDAINTCNYYGIYPSVYKTATRALPQYILNRYNLNVTTYVFGTAPGGWDAGAVYRHMVSTGEEVDYQGAFFALGLTRTPDIRVTAIGLLGDYDPRLFPANYNAKGTSRLAVLQLGLVGGV